MSVKKIADQSPANKQGLTPQRGNPRVMPNSWAGRVSVTLFEIVGHPFSLDSERGLSCACYITAKAVRDAPALYLPYLPSGV